MKEHLEERGVQFDRYNINCNRWTASFKLYTPTGKWIGYQQYRPLADKTRKNNPKFGRYYTHVTTGYLPIWGFETLDYTPSVVFACEGIFKAVRFHRFNVSAVALLGNDSKQYMNQMHLLNRKVIAICDPDDAGKKLAKVGHVAPEMEKYADDMSDAEIEVLLKKLGVI